MSKEKREAEAAYLMLLGAVSQLPAEERAKVEAVADELRAAAAKSPDAGLIALTLVSTELVFKEHSK